MKSSNGVNGAQKRGRGRRAEDIRGNERVEKTNVTVTPAVRQVLKRLGKGNLSLGVRMAARYVKEQQYKG